MKNAIFIVAVIFSLTSCGFHNGLTKNLNSNNTNVVLSEANYTVVRKVEGEASARYVLGIGGTSKKALINEARKNMLSDSEMTGKSRALIHESVEMHKESVLFVGSITVTVTAYLVEFKE